MRVVADTNTVVSGLLWSGAPRHVLNAARAGSIELFTTVALLTELEDVLGREKFGRRIADAGLTARELVVGFGALARLAEPARIDPAILDDPDDDAVLACALAVLAQGIVSGDSHLLGLKHYQGIPIFTANELLTQISE